MPRARLSHNNQQSRRKPEKELRSRLGDDRYVMYLGDEARDNGRLEEAASHYRKVRKSTSQDHHHAALKIVLLPLFAVAWAHTKGVATEDYCLKPEDSYGLCGELLEKLNAEYSSAPESGNQRRSLAGIIAETCLLAVGARDYDSLERYAMYPSSELSDRSERAGMGYDAVSVMLDRTDRAPEYVQMKFSTASCRQQYSSLITILTLEAVAAGRTNLLNPLSLANLIPMELAGRATDQTSLYLDACQDRQFAILHNRTR